MQQGAKWLAREEAAGNVYQSWPTPVVKMLGKLVKYAAHLTDRARTDDPAGEVSEPASICREAGRISVEMDGLNVSGIAREPLRVFVCRDALLMRVTLAHNRKRRFSP